MKKQLLIAVVALLMLGLTSCKDDANSGTLKVIMKDNSYFWQQVEYGLSVASKSLNYSYDVVFIDKDDDVQSQIDELKNYDESKYQGIIVAPAKVDNEEFNSLIETVSTKTPTVIIDSELEQTLSFMTFVGTNNYNAGDQYAYDVRNTFSASGKIGIIALAGSGAVLERATGFKDNMEKAGFDVVEVFVSVDNLEADIYEALTEMSDCAIIFSANLHTSEVLIAKNITEKDVYCFDVSSAILQAIENETVKATMIQDTYGMGYEALSTIVEYVSNNVTQPKLKYMSTFLLTKDNMNSEEAKYFLNEI